MQSHSRITRTLATAGAALALLVAPDGLAHAQFADDDLEVLYELDAVRVVIEAPLAPRIGLDTRLLAQRVTERLEQARIPVVFENFGPRFEEIPALTIRIHLVSVGTLVAGVYAYVAEAELREPTELYRNAAIVMLATSWRSYPRQGAIADRHPDELEFDVARMTDDFVNAYITANADLRRR